MRKPLIEKLELLIKLENDSKPLWGKMSPQHMIEHLILAVKSGNGKIQKGCFNPHEKIPVLKRFLVSARALPKDFVNPLIGPDLLPLKYENLESAKLALKQELEDYYTYFEENPDATFINPTFGELNKTEWDVFHEKHFKHHFNQFGLYD